MVKIIKILLLSFVFIIFFSGISLAAQTAELIVWIEGTIGVEVNVTDTITTYLGEKNGTWIKILNLGNIRDIIRLEGALEPENDWIDFRFVCTETVGKCDDFFSSKRHVVDNIIFTPEIQETQVYLEVIGYRKTSGMPAQRISLTGYSLTNHTKEDLKDILIEVKERDVGWGPAELPGLQDFWIVILFLLIGLVSFRKEIF